MKSLARMALMGAGIALSAFSAYAYDLKNTYYIEAEQFQFYGSWEASGVNSEAILFALKPNCEASTVVKLRQGGKYNVWARSMDYVKNQGTRLFTIEVNGQSGVLGAAGKHGKEDCLYWEKLGACEMKQGENFITLKSLTNFPRVDSVVLTKDDTFNPNEALKVPSNRRATRYNPPLYPFEMQMDFIENLAGFKPDSAAKTIKISNGAISVEFIPYSIPNSKKAYVRKVTFGNSKLSKTYFDECLSSSFSPNAKAIDVRYEIKWAAVSGILNIKLGADSYQALASSENRFAAGENVFMRPQKVEKLSELSVKLFYPDGSEAVYTLDKTAPFARFDLSATASRDGMHSVALFAGDAVRREDLRFTLMPPSYQGVRTMKEAALLGNRIMSQPISLIETKLGENSSAVTGVVADPNSFDPHEWSVNTGNSVCGFSMVSPKGMIQPSICAPVLGGRDSLLKAGDKIKKSWYVLDMRGDWTEALALVNTRLYKGSELREPWEASLSDAASNMIDYLKNGGASGFSQRHKGRWNIEHINSVTVSSPLAEVSAALLSDDEEYYKNISLPTIEYTLSRNNPHLSVQLWSQVNSREHPSINLGALSEYWSADYFAGLNNLTGFVNPLFKSLYEKPNGALRCGKNLPWTVDYGVAIADPSETAKRMPLAAEGARKWFKGAFHNRYYGEPPAMGFVNDGYYPYWWYLVDLYESTHDETFLNYARLGAFYTLSCLWNWPNTVKGNFVSNSGGRVEGDYQPMWRGTERTRLGQPECAKKKEAYLAAHPDENPRAWRNTWLLDEKVVDGRKIARMGLGIEQRWTYVLCKNSRNIMMPSWAPEMLRVWRYSGDDIIMKFSRHSIVGRFANYPGYYICDYTDVMHSPEYPYKGPDVTSLYHHHAPCAFAHTVDYLMAQIESRSYGKISFPYVRQQSYVWFTNRIYGRAGTVFEDRNCRPLISAKAGSFGTSKVSALYARGEDFIWAILLNDSGSEISVDAKFDKNSKIFSSALTDAEMQLFDANGKLSEKTYSFPDASGIKIPALGLVALKVKAAPKKLFPEVNPLGWTAHISKPTIAKGWGDMHAFRLRSPFAKDSLYVFTTAAFDKSGVVELRAKQGKTEVVKKCEVFPFEFSVYPLNMQEDISFTLTFSDESGKIVSEEFTMKP